MTATKLIGYGLIAGLSYTEVLSLAPRVVLDLYIMRQRYDDALHGIRRKRPGEWEDE